MYQIPKLKSVYYVIRIVQKTVVVVNAPIIMHIVLLMRLLVAQIASITTLTAKYVKIKLLAEYVMMVICQIQKPKNV